MKPCVACGNTDDNSPHCCRSPRLNYGVTEPDATMAPQPIETAPVDMPVLVYQSTGVRAGRWVIGEVTRDLGGNVKFVHEEFQVSMVELFSHWMPMPPAPKETP